MELFRLFGTIGADNSSAMRSLDDTEAKARSTQTSMNSSLSKVGRGFSTVGSKLSTVGQGLTNKITKPALIAGTALGGVVLKKGWDRMSSIDSAKAKLSALGNSAKDVKSIMNNALNSVKGTAYGLDEAATTAASAVASGIKPGKELEGYLKTVADTASVAGTSMQDMGSIFNKVASKGKVDAEILNQLSDNGVPALQLLGKATGKTSAEVSDMVSKGKIDFKTFQEAMAAGVDGAAVKMGSTTLKGAIANIGASISRIGANFLGTTDDANSFAGKLKGVLGGVSNNLEKVEGKAKQWGAVFGDVFGAVIQYFKNGKVETDKMSKSAQGIWSALKPVLAILKSVGNAFMGMSPKMRTMMTMGAVFAGPALKALGKLCSGVDKAITAYGKLSGAARKAAGFIKNTGAYNSAISALRRLQAELRIAGSAHVFLQNKTSSLRMAMVRTRAAIASNTVVTRIATGATKALSLAMKLMPLLLIIGGIAALAVYMKKTGTSADELANKITNGANNMANKITAFADALPGMIDGIMPAVTKVATTIVQTLPKILPGLVAAVVRLVSSLASTISQTAPQFMSAILQIVMAICSALPTLIPALINAAITLFMAIVDAIPKIIDALIAAMPKIIDAIIQGLTTGIPKLIQGAITLLMAITKALPKVIEALTNAMPKIVKAIVSALIQAAPALAKGALLLFMTMVKVLPQVLAVIGKALFSGLASVFAPLGNWFKSKFKAAADGIKSAFDGIKGFFSTVWSGIKSVTSKAWTGIKGVVVKGAQLSKTGAHQQFKLFKTGLTVIWNGMKKGAKTAWNAIKKFIVTPVKSAYSTVKSVFGRIKSAMTSPINSAKNSIKASLDKIKGFFSRLKLKLPHIDLPHFSLTGSFSLKKKTVPHLSVDWYKNGGVFDSPTLLTATNGAVRGVGEAGKEAVTPISVLQKYVAEAVNANSGDNSAILQAILSELKGQNQDMETRMAKILSAVGVKLNEREIARLVRRYA